MATRKNHEVAIHCREYLGSKTIEAILILLLSIEEDGGCDE
ncbi:hypothetical protein [Alicyclobacillus dauci]|uniref:Uncharacterized protein n=1 Tax=Alicyclobacillus dauci TaxID=1475485 RepID=A0ABY6Z2C2_9BACL|nr:hypothetical protein [Alicyclobacillus dauci]WAH36434.1 hypothetical protein NZD86_19795 [Alicyclobacillus dauci]